MKLLVILSLILTLGACSQKGAKTSAKLVILSGIGTNVAGQTGGVMVFGEGPGNFSRILETNTELVLANGAWNFYAISWDGNANAYRAGGLNASDQVFEGSTRCAVQKGANLLGGEVSINLNLTTAGCKDTFFGTANTKTLSGEPKPILPFACAFAEGVNGHDNSACRNSVAQSYKIIIPEVENNLVRAGGLISGCVTATNNLVAQLDNSSFQLKIPMFISGGFVPPIKVLLFPAASCAGIPEETVIKHLYAGIANRKISLNEQATNSYNELKIHNNVCTSAAANITATPFSPSANNDFVICTAGQFYNKINSSPSGKYDIGADLDFSDLNPFSNSIITSTFTGTIDGHNQTLSNIDFAITSPANPVGIFSQISSPSSSLATVKDLNVDNATLAVNGVGAGTIGILAGKLSGATSLENLIFTNINIELSGAGGVGVLAGLTDTALPYKVLVKNVMASNINIYFVSGASQTIGGLVGLVQNNTNIQGAELKNITFSKNAGASGSYIGGAVGRVAATSGYESEVSGILISNLSMASEVNPLNVNDSIWGGLVGETKYSKLFFNKVAGALYQNNASLLGGAIGGVAENTTINNLVADMDIFSTTGEGLKVGGLFGEIFPTFASQVTIKEARSFGDIECSQNCGSVVGKINSNVAGANISIVNTYATGDIKAAGTNPQNIGGFVGQANTNTFNANQIVISESFYDGNISTATISASSVGGIAGSAKAQFTNVYTRSNININANSTYIGGLFGTIISGSSLTNVFKFNKDTVVGAGVHQCSGTALSVATTSQVYYEASAIDGNCSVNASKVASANFTDFQTNYAAIYSSNKWSTDGDLRYHKKMVAVGESYTGSYNDPIQLSTPAQFNEIKDDASLTNKNYKLVADLDFGNGTLESIGSASVPFSGVFMGNNHVIKNAYITDASASAPLGIFRKIGYSSIFGTGKIIDFDQDSKTLKYLYLENIDVNHTGADGNTGVLAGEITDYATSSNHQEHDAVIIIGVIDLGGSTVNGAGATSSLGGLIGRANIMNSNSKLSYLDSKVSINHGGIANGVGGTVGSVSVALVAGHSRTPEFKNLIFDGNITANSTSSVGGIFGIISGQVSARIMRSTGDVSGNNYVGGIAGYWAGETIEDSFSRDNIISGANYVGGVVGKLIGSAGQIFGTYAESSVSASSNYAGCLVGQVFNTPTIDNSYANCKNVTSSGTRHFFVNGNVAGASSNLFTTDESASMTNHANATKTNTAQLIDSSSSYANILTAGDPWFWQDGDLPRPWFEVFPEFLIYEN